MRSPFSPYRNVLSMFARKEYQALTGNLSHIHLMLEVNWAKLDKNQKSFVNDLCRCSLLDIVCPGEVQNLRNDGTFKSVERKVITTNPILSPREIITGQPIDY